MMDCLTAQELLSVAADGAQTDAALLAEARTHSDTCEQCAAFVRAVSLLESVPGPAAPLELVDRIADTVLRETTARAASDSLAETNATATETRASRAAGVRDVRFSWWAPRLTVFASAAVVVLAALTLTAIGYFGGLRELAPQEADEASKVAEESGATDTLGSAESSDERRAITTPTHATAPEYISVEGLVFVMGAPIAADATALTIEGPVDGRSQEGTTAPVYAYVASPYSDVLVEESGTGWVSYSRVVRRFAGRLYQLQTGTPLTSPGQWPDLPEIYAVPTETDGSPTFHFFGYDESGVKVYVPAAGDVTGGFAIAPGTPADDPAAGNPGWTWWAPLP